MKSEAVPYQRKPDSLGFEAWQKALRKQYVPPQSFEIRRLDGIHPIFGDYSVHNPASGRSYKVALRNGGRDGEGGLNYCDCLDFRTNRLGTCKHIEAVIATVSRKRGAKKAFREGYLPPYSSVYLHYDETRRVRLRVGTENVDAFTALGREYFDEDLVLKDESRARFETFLTRAAAIDEEFRCYDDALAFVLAGREEDRRRRRIETEFVAPESTEGLLKTRLYPYQRRGILFAAAAGRSLIADEMGLGKTIQAIGTAELLRLTAGIERVLVVCPTSLKYQWRSEIARFTDSSARVIEGQPQTRAKQYREEGFFKIVSYHALAHDLEAIARMAPDLVILDEAQRIKNWKTRIAQTVKRIESPFALVLTGTPLENNLEELYSIVSFIDPYKLGPFWRFLADHQVKDETGKLIGYRGLGNIGAALADITIRRRKSEVLDDLPERIDKRIFVSMTEKQRGIHDEFNELASLLVNRWRRKGFLTEQERQRLLILLNEMRMVCDSTYILDQDDDHRHDTKIGELMGILEESLGDPDQKVVVFSQWERMTRLVARELEARGIGYRSLHGGVPSAERKELFDSFNNLPECRVFLSTDAGSVGLNLQSASILVNLDLPWNPAVLEQRIGRIHRIGQKRNVTIINLISVDTIESRMLDLIGFKSDLARGILDSGDDSIFMGDDKHRRFMNAVEEIVVATDSEKAPAPVPERAEEEKESKELAGSEAEILDDDAVEVASNDIVPPAPGSHLRKDTVPDPGELVARGVSFLADLSRSLAAPGGAKAIVEALSETDPETGATWLKIPVESRAAAAEALSTLTSLFSLISSGSRSAPPDKAP
ncbi:MAG: DEAD/DEAH box helicase [Rectinemataceae bacterium]